MHDIELVEFTQKTLKRSELSDENGQRLWETYSTMIQVEFPSPATGDAWVLRPRGKVGHLPLGDGGRISISARTSVENIFRMWEVAYGAAVPNLLQGYVSVRSLDDLFAWVTEALSRGTQEQIRRGLYRTYLTNKDDLEAVRGRIDLNDAIAHPWRVRLPCEYQELTADVEENQLLALALQHSLHSTSVGGEQASALQAYRGLIGRSVSPEPLPPDRCLGREYNRLNQAYQWLHWLCHFILSNTGPSHITGSSPTRPFVIDMPVLFEKFVASWLLRHGPADVRFDLQKKLPLHNSVEFIPDVVVRDCLGEGRYVLDTKYKEGSAVVQADVAQVVAYAAALHCPEAVLIYPSNSNPSIDTHIGTVRFRTLNFRLDGDLDVAGQHLLAELFHHELHG